MLLFLAFTFALAHPVASIGAGMAALFIGASVALAGNINQVYTGTPTSRRFALCPTTIVSGQAVLLGGVQPAVALNSYQAITGGAVFQLGGSFNLTVEGFTSLSPSTPGAIAPGAKIFADGGVTDGPTGVKYNFTLDAASAGVFFGNLDSSYTTGVLSGVTDTAAIVSIVGAS